MDWDHVTSENKIVRLYEDAQIRKAYAVEVLKTLGFTNEQLFWDDCWILREINKVVFEKEEDVLKAYSELMEAYDEYEEMSE